MKKIVKSIRKHSYKGIAFTAALLLVLSTVLAFSVSVHAAYTYTVRLYSGLQGSFNDNAINSISLISHDYTSQYSGRQRLSEIGVDVSINSQKTEIVVTGIPASDGKKGAYLLSASPTAMVKVNNDKYAPREYFRESGKDNNTISLSEFTRISEITSDKDLVVGYQMAYGLVPYTLEFYDSDSGESLATEVQVADGQYESRYSEVHYGQEGSEAKFLFPYIEGYQPGARYGTFTVSNRTLRLPYHKIVPEETSSSEEESTSSEEESSSSTAESSSSTAESSSSSSAASSSAAAVTDAAGNPVPTNADGSPVATDAAGNPVYPTDADGNPVPTDANGNLAPTDAEGRVIPTDAEGNTLATDEEGNVIEPSGGESETDETESGSEEETEESSSEIQETMNFDDETSGPAASSDFESEESSNGGQGETTKPTEPEGKKTFAQKLLDIIKRPIFIIGSLLGIGLIILLIILLTKNRKKNDDLNIEEKNGK